MLRQRLADDIRELCLRHLWNVVCMTQDLRHRALLLTLLRATPQRYYAMY